MNPIRIGSVPYLNAKPLIAWFHSKECDANVEISYAVPSQLAAQLRRGELDVAMVSTFELFQNPGLTIVPGISISADGPVKSVRLFSKVPIEDIKSVGLDSSSLTSCALIRVLVTDLYAISPEYFSHFPDLDAMLAQYDSGLIIGDLKLFESDGLEVMDLGGAWKRLTGLPFCYAAWLARIDAPAETAEVLDYARAWGCARLDAVADEWAPRMSLPLERVRDYLIDIMRYDLSEDKWRALEEFQARCLKYNLVDTILPLR